MEFTKTSHRADEARVRDAPQDEFIKTEARKYDQSPDYYFDRASKNQPIRSSIPVVVADARKLAQGASDAAERAEKTNRIFVGAGVLAIVGVIVGLFSQFSAVNTNVVATHNLIATVSSNATKAESDANRAIDDVKSLRNRSRPSIRDTQRRSSNEFRPSSTRREYRSKR